MKIENLILKNLIKNEEYCKKVLPFLKDEYFSLDLDNILFKEIKDFMNKYNHPPTKDAIIIEIDKLSNVSDETVKELKNYINELLINDSVVDDKWLIDTTEKFCQERAIYHGLILSMNIMKNEAGHLTKGSIPKILTDALSVSFDPNIGHDFFEQYEQRFEHYHEKLERIPFDLDFFNKITKGGLPKKTLSVVMAPVGSGKSLFMCHVAAACVNMGKNPLYITLELSEEEVSKRIEANLMNIPLDYLMELPKNLYLKKIEMLKSKSHGKLIVKEYPTASANALHFKALLNELYLKKSFKPDIIIIDYINICASSRIKPGSNVNSYSYIKSIAEELRGLAVEHNIPLLTATQVNRSGMSSSDIEMTETSESIGLPMTTDFFFALIATEELLKLNQVMVKQLKNRWSDISINKKFIIGIDKSRMKLYDCEKVTQQNISDSGQQIPDRSDKWKKLKVS